MRVYFSDHSDPMITDTVAGLNAIASRIKDFLESDDFELFIKAEDSGSPEPYDKLLSGVRLKKSNGPIMVSLHQNGLHVTGSLENLKTWGSYFKFSLKATEGDHHHPEYVQRKEYISPASLSVIIEVQDAV